MDKQTQDIDWIAWQYVTGDLSQDEANRFESRMADDEACCVALSRAVELVELTLRARPLEPVVLATTSPIRQASRLWWPAVAAVCVICLALFRSFLMTPSSEPKVAAPAKAAQETPADAELAIAWSQMADPEPPGMSEESTDEGMQVESQDSERESVDPSWVMVAISGIEMHHDELD